ncbi:RagB/SusD family nutrient uptake outer membrane protein [Hymenobacter crusticola]|uniref:RagB/SusD family nutrient uptake outer membrane protein n=1 Tax=Hymenobacter crusticola TaxID=1770526 RepID=A0A243W762_9BACT|nr:RagB/SusD family nutrient uptake outer membrane protein [Hymenobacter crusticola]OUJ70553.1 RagB/SusD family nutrient uptake outer membrane protein [Hymenobacter crusticola]
MKKVFIPVLALALLGSCNVLDKEPLASVVPNNFFQNADDAESAITSAYDGLQMSGYYGQDLPNIGMMPSDDCTSTNNDVNALEIINWFPTTSQMGNAYRDMYRAINRANAVIKYVQPISMPTERRNQILGEAYFLRALHYFNLVRVYGGVPLHLDPTESADPGVVSIARASADDVYAQILADLAQAENLTTTTFGDNVLNRARATKTTVNALQARVFLTRRQWSDAQTAANKVLSNNTSVLATNFNALYPPDNNAESIFEVQFAGNSDGGFLLPDEVLPNPPATYSYAKFDIPTLYRDPRLAQPTDLTFAVDTVNDLRWKRGAKVTGGVSYVSVLYAGRNPAKQNDSGFFIYKWRSNPNGFNSPDNYYVLRLADVYLMYAEAANEQSGPTADALSKLNAIRQRAGLPALTLAQLATKQAFRDEVDLQRRRELAFEGERWFDLVRYARQTQADASASHKITALDMIQQKRNSRDVNYLLFPLPQSELNNNALIQQNPGY